MSGLLLAIVVAVVGVSITAFWFGVSRRRKAETEIGIQALANMKWRDCIAVVLEALHRDGYSQLADSTVKGGETEFLLTYGDDQRALLGYKHGTAYHLSDANVREFVNATHLRGARRGILLTLGSATGSANRAASSHDVELLDGGAVWPKVRQFLPPELLNRVRKQAAAKTRQGLWAGAAVSVLAGAVIFFLSDHGLPDQVTIAAIEVHAPTVASKAQAPRSDAAMLAQINATAQAMAEVAKLSDAELARRRVDAAKRISLIPQVDAAAWSAQRTLLVKLNKTDGKDNALLEEVCRVLTQNEEMRFTRLQLEPPESSGTSVRWRLCE